MEKAQAITVTTIIIVILAVLTLVIIAAAFTGGMTEMWRKLTGFYKIYSASDIEAARGLCRTWCATGAYDSFCTHEFAITKGEATEPHKCPDRLLRVNCPEAKCA